MSRARPAASASASASVGRARQWCACACAEAAERVQPAGTRFPSLSRRRLSSPRRSSAVSVRAPAWQVPQRMTLHAALVQGRGCRCGAGTGFGFGMGGGGDRMGWVVARLSMASSWAALYACSASSAASFRSSAPATSARYLTHTTHPPCHPPPLITQPLLFLSHTHARRV
eukprot:3241052-Rhodomonas_salina.1